MELGQDPRYSGAAWILLCSTYLGIPGGKITENKACLYATNTGLILTRWYALLKFPPSLADIYLKEALAGAKEGCQGGQRLGQKRSDSF